MLMSIDGTMYIYRSQTLYVLEQTTAKVSCLVASVPLPRSPLHLVIIRKCFSGRKRYMCQCWVSVAVVVHVDRL